MGKWSKGRFVTRGIAALLAGTSLWALMSTWSQRPPENGVQIAYAAIVLYGCFLFGFFAARGRLPGARLRRVDAAWSRKTGLGRR